MDDQKGMQVGCHLAQYEFNGVYYELIVSKCKFFRSGDLKIVGLY